MQKQQYKLIQDYNELYDVIDMPKAKLYTSHAEGIHLYISRELLLRKPEVLLRAMLRQKQLYYKIEK